MPHSQSPASAETQPESEQPSGSLSAVTETPVLDPVPFSGPSPFPPFMEAPQDTPTLPPPGYGSWNDSTFRVRAKATTRPVHSARLSLHRSPQSSPRSSLPNETARPASMGGFAIPSVTTPPTRLPAIDGPTASSATDALMLLFAMADAPDNETSSDTDESVILPATAPPARSPAAVGPASSSATDAPVQADAARPHGPRNRIIRIARSSNPRVAPPPIAQRIASRGNHGSEARTADTVDEQAALEEALSLVSFPAGSNPGSHVPIWPPFDLQTGRVTVPVNPARAQAAQRAVRVPDPLSPRDNITSGARPADTADFDVDLTLAMIAERRARRAASSTNFDERISTLRDLLWESDNLAEPRRRNALPTTLGEYQEAMMAAYEAGKEAAAKEARLKQAREADNTE